MRIGITRDEAHALEFIDLVRSIGLDAVALDIIRLIPITNEIERLKDKLDGDYDYVLFMSPNAIDLLDASIINKLKNKKIIAVGPKTRRKLEDHGIRVDLMPKRYSSYGIVELLREMDIKDKSILIPRSAAASNYLKDQLERLNIKVDEVRFYDTKPNYDTNLRDKVKDLDCIVFTSASNVHAFFKLVDKIDSRVIAIGPFTNDALREYGVDAIVADEHTIEGVFKEIKKIIS